MKTALLFRVGAVLTAFAVAGCNANSLEDIAPKAPQSDYAVSSKLSRLTSARGMAKTAPIMLRIFKEENALEVWKQRTDGRYGLVTTYQMCRWSGKLGPKFTEGDRQAPEGFYTVSPGQMNPNSKFYLAFNMGYPNAFDRANGRTGAHLMVHGACSSSGCYSMTDGQMQEIYALARDAFAGGQTAFQVQAFPFRMTAANMARYKDDPNFGFWQMLKEGYDRFEVSKVPPKVNVCGKRYAFSDGTSPAVDACAARSAPAVADNAYRSYQASYASAYSAAAAKPSQSPPRASILGPQEAALVADWSKKKARGERVPLQPPTMKPDGSVVATTQMGRIDNEVGRRQAAKEAREAEIRRLAEEKKAAEARAAAELAAKKEAIRLAEDEAKQAREAAKLAAAPAPSAEKAGDARPGTARSPGTGKDQEVAAAAATPPAAAAAEAASTEPAGAVDAVKAGVRTGVKKLWTMIGG